MHRRALCTRSSNASSRRMYRLHVTQLHYSRSHTCREILNGRNCSKRAEYVTDISLSPEFRAYIFPRNYSCIRQRYAMIKLNGRECRANAKSVDAISRKKKKT